MKITSIKQQVKRAARYSVFIDDKYAFSLSETALLKTKLVKGQDLTGQQVKNFKKLSAKDKTYNLALRYIAIRPRSRWEMEFYLKRKDASPALTEFILNKLSNISLIDDEKFAQAYINGRRLLRPASRRKIIMELRKKHLADNIIQLAIGNEPEDERAALLDIIGRKRQQTRYKDNLKLMQYLARQGFNYEDIKSALAARDNL